MTFKIQDVTASLLTVLRAGGAWSIGDNELPLPLPADAPWGILVYIPGAASTGGMAGNQEMLSAIFQLKCVGYSVEQCRRFQQKMHEVLEAGWDSVAYCMGPPRLVLGGIVSDDQRTFEVNDTIYMEVTS